MSKLSKTGNTLSDTRPPEPVFRLLDFVVLEKEFAYSVEPRPNSRALNGTVRLHYQPLFGKWARAPTPKDWILESSGNSTGLSSRRLWVQTTAGPTTRVLKKAGKTMLVVIWDIISVQRIASLGGDVKLLALFPSSFCHWSNLKGRKRTHTTVRKAEGKFWILIQVSEKLPTYPSPKPTFCPKWQVSDNAG